MKDRFSRPKKRNFLGVRDSARDILNVPLFGISLILKAGSREALLKVQVYIFYMSAKEWMLLEDIRLKSVEKAQ